MMDSIHYVLLLYQAILDIRVSVGASPGVATRRGYPGIER